MGSLGEALLGLGQDIIEIGRDLAVGKAVERLRDAGAYSCHRVEATKNGPSLVGINYVQTKSVTLRITRKKSGHQIMLTTLRRENLRVNLLR